MTTSTGVPFNSEDSGYVRVYNSVVTLLDSADDTGCSGDCIVVSKSALRLLAQQVLEDLPKWLEA